MASHACFTGLSATLTASLLAACFSPSGLTTTTDATGETGAESADTSAPNPTAAPTSGDATDPTLAATTADASVTSEPEPDPSTTALASTSGTSADATTADTSDTGDALCGNAVVDEGEQCDDGNLDENDGCTSVCGPPACGDGVITLGEECDDGNTATDDACLDTCTTAKCGDGFVHVGVELCDDGNADNLDACKNDCTVNPCGNGVLEVGEQCDDLNTKNLDGCSATCQRDAAFVFITDEKFNGVMANDGLKYAATLCTTEAVGLASSLPGEHNLGSFLPWMSDDDFTPAMDFTQSMKPYVRPDGAVVANDWSDLVDGTLASPIRITSSLQNLPNLGNDCSGEVVAWTGTTTAGQLGPANCNDWTFITNTSAVIGSGRSSSATWTDCDTSLCISQARVYCFEQLD